MSILGDIPQTKGQKAVRLLCHFALGAFFGLFPALLVVSAATMDPGKNDSGIVGIVFLIFCVPPGLIFVALGLVGRGQIIPGLFRLLGRHVDPNSIH